MRLRLPYGPGLFDVEVPDGARVVRPVDLPGLPDPATVITAGLRQPRAGRSLDELVRPGCKVVVVFPDITRPMPNQVVLPPLLSELGRLGIGPDRVTLLCSTGTHRPATSAEMQALVGAEIFHHYRVHQHVATDGEHVDVGTVEGTAVLLDRRYVDADIRIVTGFVEPHFFAGFSGGPKAVCPGVAALDTILEAHSPTRILDPGATWMEIEANPVHRFVRRATALLPPDLSVDVAINNKRELTAVFVGCLPDAHRVACEFVNRNVVCSVPAACDVVVTTNAGLPLDRNLYQAVKGMSAAARIVRPGGDIVMMASCVDGYPDEGAFAGIVKAAPSAAALTNPAIPPSLDTWQAQVLGRVLAKATVHLFTGGLSPDQIRDVHLQPIGDPSVAVAELVKGRGLGATVCVLPDGPLTVATVATVAAVASRSPVGDSGEGRDCG
jgi:lactate racemase